MAKVLAAVLICTLTLPGAAVAKGPKHCPPGLAKKDPACVPPGQAKKRDTYRDTEREASHDYGENDTLRVGDRVIFGGREYTVVEAGHRIVLRRDDDWYRLPDLRDGSEYFRVGDAILRVDRKTKAVFEIIELADLILN